MSLVLTAGGYECPGRWVQVRVQLDVRSAPSCTVTYRNELKVACRVRVYARARGVKLMGAPCSSFSMIMAPGSNLSLYIC